jgi:hypothetical protein
MKGKEGLSLTITNTNQSVAFSVTASSLASSRLLAISGAYEYYRFKKLKFVVPPQTRWETALSSGFNDTAQSAALAFLPEVPVGAVSGLGPSTILELEASKPFQYNLGIEGAASSFVMSVPGNTNNWELQVPRDVLQSVPGKWYRVNAITEDLLAVQGTLLVAVTDAAGSNTVVFKCQMCYEIEFSGQADNADI